MDDKSLEILTAMRVDIAEIRKDLNHHIYRTEINEANLELLRDDFNSRMKPVEAHINRLEGVVRALGVISLVLGIGYSVIAALAHVFNW